MSSLQREVHPGRRQRARHHGAAEELRRARAPLPQHQELLGRHAAVETQVRRPELGRRPRGGRGHGQCGPRAAQPRRNGGVHLVSDATQYRYLKYYYVKCISS